MQLKVVTIFYRLEPQNGAGIERACLGFLHKSVWKIFLHSKSIQEIRHYHIQILQHYHV